MVPFPIEIEWQNRPLSLLAEQLDNLADEEGFIRFDIRGAGRRSVIFVNVEDQPQPLITPQDLESYFEVQQYPELPAAFSFDETFTAGEVVSIGKVIWEHFNAGHLSSAAQTLLL